MQATEIGRPNSPKSTKMGNALFATTHGMSGDHMVRLVPKVTKIPKNQMALPSIVFSISNLSCGSNQLLFLNSS